MKHHIESEVLIGMDNGDVENNGCGEQVLETVMHVNHEVRYVSAMSLAILTGRHKNDVGITEKMFMQTAGALNQLAASKQQESSVCGSGHLLLLGALWQEIPHMRDTRTSIVYILLDWLRRVEFSASCRAHALYSLGTILDTTATSSCSKWASRSDQSNLLMQRMIIHLFIYRNGAGILGV